MPIEKVTDTIAGPSSTHAYTLADLVKAIKNALALTPDPETADAARIVNDAIAYLTALHPWVWREKAMTLASVADASSITLPADFSSLKVLYPIGSALALLETTLDEIVKMRSYGTYTGASPQYFAITFSSQQSAAALPLYKLEIFPTPTATVASFISGIYFRRVALLTGDTNYPDLPALFHPLLARLCRAMALSYEEQAATGHAAEEWAVFQQQLVHYINEDGRNQTSLGLIRGAVLDVRHHNLKWTPDISLT